MRYKSQILILVLLSVLPIFFNNCGQISQPKVENASMMGIAHPSSNTASCSICHEKDRPIPVNGVAHFGTQDCKGCHVVSSTWATGVSFNHNPLPNSCSSCHMDKQPAPVNGLPHWDNMDCFGCHAATNWKSTRAFSHRDSKNAPINYCLSCH